MSQSNAVPNPPAFKRPFRLAHQSLCIVTVDFSQCLLLGFTQLVIWPLENSLRRIPLNVRQCKVHRIRVEAAEDYFKGPIDPHNCVYPPTDVNIAFSDPLTEISKQDSKCRTLDNYELKHTPAVAATDPDEGGGELTVRIPTHLLGLVIDKRPLLITIEFSLSRPKYGFHFVIPDDGSLEDAHAFTAGTPNSSRSWFPCLDCNEPCTWKIEVTVAEEYLVVASGELLGPAQYTEDLRAKTYQFYLAQPVSAPSIGMAIGAFDILPHPGVSATNPSLVMTDFCPKGLKDLMEHTVAPLSGVVEYYEGELASQFPFHSLNTVFVDRAFEDHQSFASLIIFSVDLLHSARIIDQAIATRQVYSFAVAQQFFGCALQAETWAAAWLPYGIAGYLAGLYQKRIFGNNEYRYLIANEMRTVTAYEHSRFGVVLDPTNTVRKKTYFSLKYPQVGPGFLFYFLVNVVVIVADFKRLT